MADKDYKTPKDYPKITNQNNQPADSATINTRQNSSDVITPRSISAPSLMQQKQNDQHQQITNNYRSQGVMSAFHQPTYPFSFVPNQHQNSYRPTAAPILARPPNMTSLPQNNPGVFNGQINAHLLSYQQPQFPYRQNYGQYNSQHVIKPLPKPFSASRSYFNHHNMQNQSTPVTFDIWRNTGRFLAPTMYPSQSFVVNSNEVRLQTPNRKSGAFTSSKTKRNNDLMQKSSNIQRKRPKYTKASINRFNQGLNQSATQRPIQQPRLSAFDNQNNIKRLQAQNKRLYPSLSTNQTKADTSYQQNPNKLIPQSSTLSTLTASPTSPLDLIQQVPSVPTYLLAFHDHLRVLAEQNNKTARSILSVWEPYGIDHQNKLSVDKLQIRHQGERLFSEEFIKLISDIAPLHDESLEIQQISDQFLKTYKNHQLMSTELLNVLQKKQETRYEKINLFNTLLFHFLRDEYQEKQFIKR